MKLTFIGAAHEVTGSCTLLEACGKRILIDFGLEQGADIYENCEFPGSLANLDCVCLTHAHIDHSGKLPFLTANGFSGQIHATAASCKLCAIMLRDSAHIQETEAVWRKRKAQRAGDPEYVPLYTVEDAENTIPLFVPHQYDEEFSITEGITVRFIDAGHLLGSSSILFTLTEDGVTKKIIFSGDVGNPEKPLLNHWEIPPEADFAVIESTYADRLHPKADKGYALKLAKTITDTFDKGGNLVIPAFAVGRTQELLYYLRIIKENNLVAAYPHFPVYLDSPLAIEATSIYSDVDSAFFSEEARELLRCGINPIACPDLKLSVSSDDSKAINEDRTPKVIISASGMCEAGRIRHHLKHNLWRSESTILFSGYQVEGTIGRKLQDGEKYVKLFGEDIAVKADICQLEGFSSHADRDLLIEWLSHTRCRQVFVNHGNDEVCDNFAVLLEQRLGVSAMAPYSGDVYDLAEETFEVKVPIRKLVSKKKEASRKAGAVYDRLKAAGNRLMKIIEENKGGSNKELSRFADQIIALCDKYAK